MSSATETESPRDHESSAITDDASARSASANDAGDGHASTSLGTERWVIFAFLLGAFVVFWLSKNLIVAVWDRFDEPRPVVANAVAAILALGAAFFTYQRPNIHAFATDVAHEYTKITWPSKDEAWSHTLVVILVSAVSTVILAGFDFAWSSLANLLYQ